jgi:hypothetical protein
MAGERGVGGDSCWRGDIGVVDAGVSFDYPI